MATPSASLLRAFARYMKDHPDVPEEQVIEVFAGNDRSEEEATLALATPESCVTTGPQPIPKRATISTNYDFMPPTPDSFSEAVLPPSLTTRPLSPTLEIYLDQPPSDDPVFLPEDWHPSETRARSTPNIQLDASRFWEYVSGSTTHVTLGSTAAVAMDQHIDAPSFGVEAFFETATSRTATDSTRAITFDSAYFEPQQSGSSLYSEHDDTANLSGISQVFNDFEYRSPPIVSSTKRRAEVPVEELHRRVAEKALNSSLGRTKALKRISTGRPKDDQFPSSNKQTKPQQSGNSQTRTGSSTWVRGAYVRPRHPRVLCPLCPDGHTGFRGDHEYRRHHERIHAKKKRVWVVRDKSGTGLLSRCKACSTGRRYGVDYNATAHLRRQHFNPEKTPGIVMPDNIRDWIEAIEVDVGIEGEPRKRGGKKSKAQVAKEKESQSLESLERVGETETEQESEKGEYPSWDGEEEEEEGDGGEFEVMSETDRGGSAIEPVTSYIQKLAAEREQTLRIASKLSTEALLSGPDNWTQFDEHFAFTEKTARDTDGATVEVSQRTFTHAAVSASGSTMTNTASPDLYHFNRYLLQEHRLPHDFSVGVGGCTVSPSDLCMIPLGDNSPF